MEDEFNTVYKLQLFSKRVKFFWQISAHDANSVEVDDIIPKSVLPVEYGGDDGSIQELTGKLCGCSKRKWYIYIYII